MMSPCIKSCQIDPVNELCVGCFRTLEEIEHWIKYTHDERTYIMEILEKRKDDYMGNISKQS